MRLHPGVRPRHAVRLEPGRLHAELHLLPHRHAALVRNLTARRDRRPGCWSRATGSAIFPAASRRPTGSCPSGEGVRAVSNIVFMGMGEPLYNLDHVATPSPS